MNSNSEIDIQRLSSIVRTLASDEFEGRAPGGRGEEKTVANLTLDILQTAGPARDVILVGEGQSELENDL